VTVPLSRLCRRLDGEYDSLAEGRERCLDLVEPGGVAEAEQAVHVDFVDAGATELDIEFNLRGLEGGEGSQPVVASGDFAGGPGGGKGKSGSTGGGWAKVDWRLLWGKE
jgi:hypothetical protein